MICCPVTTKIKGYPFEVALTGQPASVALADQVKSLDWRARKAQRKGRVAPVELRDIRAKARALIGCLRGNEMNDPDFSKLDTKTDAEERRF